MCLNFAIFDYVEKKFIHQSFNQDVKNIRSLNANELVKLASRDLLKIPFETAPFSKHISYLE